MLKIREKQMNFNDTDYLCSRLIPENNFYRKFREIVEPLLKDEVFSSMYSADNGRPAISPALLSMATILQFYRNLTDREMERACMYDLEIKYALRLRVDDRPFDHSSLGDFRKRLLAHGKEKEIFDRILNKLVESGLIKRNEIQRIDATHVIADVAVPTMITLVKKCTREVLKSLKGQQKHIYKTLESKVDLEKYTRETVNKTDAGKEDVEKRKIKLLEVVTDAREVLKSVSKMNASRVLRKKVDLLKRIMQENLIEDENGHPVEMENKKKPKNILVSPIDEDARYGAKSKTKRFVGYKANITESVENRIITNIKAMGGNRRDGDDMVEMVKEQKRYGLSPMKIVGDTAYSDGKYRQELKEENVQVVAPLRISNGQTKDVFPKRMFKYDEQSQKLTCPQRVQTEASWMDSQKQIKVFHFPMSVCQSCKVFRKCTKSKEGRRTVGISMVNTELREAESYNQTEEFKNDMKLRPMVEGKLSELVRYHGMRRSRYRGLGKLNLQCYFTATAVNIKRWFKLLEDQLKPDKEIQFSF
ncbi:MAG: IS1182 family transposase [Candidatus Omnitrophota bacterium]